MEYLELPDGRQMPVLGLGTWQATDLEGEAAVERALEEGYRLIDTAAMYGNEQAVGNVLKRWVDAGKIKREDFFVTTKVWPTYLRQGGDIRRSIDESLRRLQLSYVDLFLVHHSLAFVNLNSDFQTFVPKDVDGNVIFEDIDLCAVWKDMEDIQRSGLSKNIGVSNFNHEQIERVAAGATVPIANLQVELNVYLAQERLVKFCQEKNITVTAYAPLGSKKRECYVGTRPEVLDDPIIARIAKKRDKTPAQVLQRHLTQRGICCVPKSSNPQRIKENIQIFGFKLDDAEMQEILALDQNMRNFDHTYWPGAEKQKEFPFNTW